MKSALERLKEWSEQEGSPVLHDLIDEIEDEMKRSHIGLLIERDFCRQQKVRAMEPYCPSCGTQQVQIMRWDEPAEWRCRSCSHYFIFERR